MRLLYFIYLILFACPVMQAQQLLNGSFEINTAAADELNLANERYAFFVAHSASFGTKGNIDLIRSADYCSPAQDGNWYIAMTGGGTDAISLTLSRPLIPGEEYVISFFDRSCYPTTQIPQAVQIGVSTDPENFGTLLYTAPITTDHWVKRRFLFKAPIAGQYITARVDKGDSFNTWAQVDHFTIECSLEPDLGNDTTICAGKELLLQAGDAGYQYRWQDGSQSANYTVSTTGVYWVEVSNSYCSKSDTILVSAEVCTDQPFIPGAFTPNGDGINERFSVLGTIKTLQMRIFDRWGRLVFQTTNIMEGWDGRQAGKPLPVGTYVYDIRLTDANDKQREYKGTVILLR